MTPLILAGVVKQSITDGPGLRMTIFTQGCPHHCDGCHNPATWPFNKGKEYTTDTLLTEFGKNPLLKGVTLSGGEPLCQIKALLPFVKGIKARGKDVVCYTGYTLEELLVTMEEDPLLKELLYQIDFLVDGLFIQSLRDLTLPFRGSANQRFLDLQQSLLLQKAVEYPL